jgi:hypothetical protein
VGPRTFLDDVEKRKFLTLPGNTAMAISDVRIVDFLSIFLCPSFVFICHCTRFLSSSFVFLLLFLPLCVFLPFTLLLDFPFPVYYAL